MAFLRGAEVRALVALLSGVSTKLQVKGPSALLDPAARLLQGVAYASARRIRTTAEWYAAKAEATVRADAFTAGVKAVLQVRAAHGE